jgi:hypothetical protein
VGRHSPGQGLVLTVMRKKNHLSTRENDEPAEDMFPEGEPPFFRKNADDVVTF